MQRVFREFGALPFVVMAGHVPGLSGLGPQELQRDLYKDTGSCNLSHPLPGLDPGIHVFASVETELKEVVDDRVKPGRGEYRLAGFIFAAYRKG
jgi:hypothetical protein